MTPLRRLAKRLSGATIVFLNRLNRHVQFAGDMFIGFLAGAASHEHLAAHGGHGVQGFLTQTQPLVHVQRFQGRRRAVRLVVRLAEIVKRRGF